MNKIGSFTASVLNSTHRGDRTVSIHGHGRGISILPGGSGGDDGAAPKTGRPELPWRLGMCTSSQRPPCGRVSCGSFSASMRDGTAGINHPARAYCGLSPVVWLGLWPLNDRSNKRSYATQRPWTRDAKRTLLLAIVQTREITIFDLYSHMVQVLGLSGKRNRLYPEKKGFNCMASSISVNERTLRRATFALGWRRRCRHRLPSPCASPQGL